MAEIKARSKSQWKRPRGFRLSSEEKEKLQEEEFQSKAHAW